MKPLVSVIIPVLNNWIYTKSLLNDLSGISNIEIIVIDSVSTDATQKQMEKLADNKTIRYYRSPKNLYVNGAWNKWVKMAKGKYVVIMNNDLKIRNPKILIEKLIEPLQYIGNIMLTSPIYTLWEDDTITSLYKGNRSNPNNICWHCFCMLKSDWIPIPEDMKIRCGDNWIYETIIRRWWLINDWCMWFIHHYESKTVNKSRENIQHILDDDRYFWDTEAIALLKKIK